MIRKKHQPTQAQKIYGMTTEKHFSELSKEEQEKINRFDLREMKLYYGDWNALLKVIRELQHEDNERAWERAQNRYL